MNLTDSSDPFASFFHGYPSGMTACPLSGPANSHILSAPWVVRPIQIARLHNASRHAHAAHAAIALDSGALADADATIPAATIGRRRNPWSRSAGTAANAKYRLACRRDDHRRARVLRDRTAALRPPVEKTATYWAMRSLGRHVPQRMEAHALAMALATAIAPLAAPPVIVQSPTLMHRAPRGP